MLWDEDLQKHYLKHFSLVFQNCIQKSIMHQYGLTRCSDAALKVLSRCAQRNHKTLQLLSSGVAAATVMLHGDVARLDASKRSASHLVTLISILSID